MNNNLMPRRGRILRKVGMVAAVLVLLTVLLATISAGVNHFAPRHSRTVESLDAQQKALLGEALQLKTALGDSIWPGFGRAEIPLVIWNEQRSFLLGNTAPPAGWEHVRDDSFCDHPYYYGRMERNQAFAVQVGHRWAGSLATREWLQIAFAREFGDKLPGPLRPVFPYPLVIRVLGLRSSEQYISAILHEVFHAYQAEKAPGRFALAQHVYIHQPEYPWDNPEIRRAWTSELQLLARALDVKSNAEASDLARQFLQVRRHRRQHSALSSVIVDYERQVEWLEGLAKYAELGAWRGASLARSKGYRPLAELSADPEFKNYTSFAKRWSGEMSTLKWQASQHSDTRFYYSGMAQAFLLDRLMPEWKTRVLLESVSMDDLLAQGVDPTGRSLSSGQ